jgi:hypothetical protein
MSKLKLLLSKYPEVKRKYKGVRVKFNPNNKWVEYRLDLLEARALLQAADFVTKFDVEKLIKRIESKLYYHENHEDFSIKVAGESLRSARRLLKM